MKRAKIDHDSHKLNSDPWDFLMNIEQSSRRKCHLILSFFCPRKRVSSNEVVCKRTCFIIINHFHSNRFRNVGYLKSTHFLSQ